MSYLHEITLPDRTITLEFGKYAKQTNGAVMVTCGSTQVLCTVTASAEPKENPDFLPLTVDYIEKFYAAGRFPGGFVKRETRPGELETLIARVIDRSIRPCFPEGYFCDTFVVCTVLSVDKNYDPAALSLLGTSCALMISDIPFNGPVAGCHVGADGDKFLFEPPKGQTGDLDLFFSVKSNAVLMVEGSANFASENRILNAISFAQRTLEPLLHAQEVAREKVGLPKREVAKVELRGDLLQEIETKFLADIISIYSIEDKAGRKTATASVNQKILEHYDAVNDPMLRADIKRIVEELRYRCLRELTLQSGKRADGRSHTDIRPISCETGLLMRTHGSALFQRGETQALATVTLGSNMDTQSYDSVSLGRFQRRFFLHYNFPPFSVGEARFLKPPGRREVGHANLAERALECCLPPEEKFGYTIRLVSEILESNGSSSMATVCAGTMALLDAGVPLSGTVAGIAMGLIKEGKDFCVLSDIIDEEDFFGDMDFKVCGNQRGITALQMDIKVDGIDQEILAVALKQARKGYESILEKMEQAISQPQDLSEYAPRILEVKVDSQKLRALIGPGGRNIKDITAKTGAKIDIADDGTVRISALEAALADRAKDMVLDSVSDPEVGRIYNGTVQRVLEFGAFVEIKPGLDGLCHISELSIGRDVRIEDVIKEGTPMQVKLISVDRQGRLKLSQKQVALMD